MNDITNGKISSSQTSSSQATSSQPLNDETIERWYFYSFGSI